MTDYTELKRLAEAVRDSDIDWEPDQKSYDYFQALRDPRVVLTLIAENERLTKAVGLQVIRRFVGDDDQKNIDELVAAGIQVDRS